MSSNDKTAAAPAASKKASNTQPSSLGATAAEPTEESVREFLKDNGDFLQRNPDLLDYLHISHASGSAVSLVEKQVSVLRERNVEIRHRLKTLTATARENDKLYEQTRALVVKLLEADSVAGLYRAFMESTRDGFKVEYASMILFADDAGERDYRVDTLDNARSHVGALIGGNKAICGTLREEEFSYLFSRAGSAHPIHDGGSAAVMPLANGEQLGLIAVGSSDPNRYTGGMGTLFLSHIADVMVRLLPRLSGADG